MWHSGSSCLTHCAPLKKTGRMNVRGLKNLLRSNFLPMSYGGPRVFYSFSFHSVSLLYISVGRGGFLLFFFTLNLPVMYIDL